MYTNKKEIEDQQWEWTQDTYLLKDRNRIRENEEEGKEQEGERRKIKIKKKEIKKAMKQMAKEKALSIDGISDTIFKKETWKDIWREIKNERDGNDRNVIEDQEEERGIREIEDKLSQRLKEYFNHCISEKEELLHDENKLE